MLSNTGLLQKRMLKRLDCRHSLQWCLNQQISYKIFQPMVLYSLQIKTTVDYLLNRTFSAGVEKGRAANIQLIGDTPNSPHIDREAMFVVEHDLGGSIIQSPYIVLRRSVDGAPEIPDFECMTLSYDNYTWDRKMLAGFRSRWMMPLSWRQLTPSSSQLMIYLI